MQSLDNSYGKSPFSYEPGDLIRSSIVNQVEKARIESVSQPNSNGEITIVTKEKEKYVTHKFQPGQPVAFPRRPNGATKVHFEDRPHVSEVMVGDVVPGPDGWPNETPDLKTGRFITDIQPSRRFNGFVVSYRNTDGTPGGKMVVGAASARYYGSDWMEFSDSEAQVTNTRYFRKEPQNCSGVYENLETDERCRFRIKGFRGRPPKDYEVREAPKANEMFAWDPWLLIEGRRHPLDLRK